MSKSSNVSNYQNLIQHIIHNGLIFQASRLCILLIFFSTIISTSGCKVFPGTVVRMGVHEYWVSNRPLQKASAALQQTMSRSKESGYMVQLITYHSTADLLTALKKGKIDLALLDPDARCQLDEAYSDQIITHLLPHSTFFPEGIFELSWVDMPAGDSAMAVFPDSNETISVITPGIMPCPFKQPIPRPYADQIETDPHAAFMAWQTGKAKTLYSPGLLAKAMVYGYRIPDSTYTRRLVQPMGGNFAIVARQGLDPDIFATLQDRLIREKGWHILATMGAKAFVAPGDSSLQDPLLYQFP